MERGIRRTGPVLLAPAGSRAAVDAVLAAGADAVYVGAGGWGRGGAAAGMPAREIARAAEACRRAGASIQVALNTIPARGELPAFRAVLRRLRDDGIGGVILSDAGAVALVRREFPDLSVCASVGTAALNPADARFWRDLGADALVLPTAVAREDVAAIKAAGGLALEVFAWCRPEFVLQGRCLLTGYARDGAAGGRDGVSGPDGEDRTVGGGAGSLSSAKRRGRCHFVCRSLPVALSPHTIEDDLAAWIEAGVDAFKIEGRDLPAGTLRGIVARIRTKLDRALAQAAERRAGSS